MHKLKKNAANLALSLAAFLVALLLAEGLLSVYRVVKHGKVGREELIAWRARDGLRDDIVGGAGDPWENRLVLHPLFGYIYNPKDEGINNFGFHTNYNIYLTESGYSIKSIPGKAPLIVGIFGGSFAELVGSEYEYLEEKLEPIFPESEIAVMNFAVGGHALPQSAFIFLYFRELFDVVVFIDGLNEPWNYTQNNDMGFPPEYAKAVHYTHKISRQELTPKQFERTSRILSSRRKIHSLTSMSLLPVVRQSLVVHYIWRVLWAHWSRTVSETSLAIQEDYISDERFFDVDADTMMSFAAQQWRRYHLLIHQVSSAEGALSLHLLQPNPFVPNSKVLTPEEKHLVTNSLPIENYVVTGYPKLQAEIPDLRSQGLVVEDLTDIYRGIDTSIWRDAAHTNQKGERLIMDKIAVLIEANEDLISHPAIESSGFPRKSGHEEKPN